MVLMVRLFWVFFFLGFGLAVSAQDDPVLMRINGKEVLRSEFERSYNKGGTSVGAGRKALDAYVNKFIDFRLKIEAASSKENLLLRISSAIESKRAQPAARASSGICGFNRMWRVLIRSPRFSIN